VNSGPAAPEVTIVSLKWVTCTLLYCRVCCYH